MTLYREAPDEAQADTGFDTRLIWAGLFISLAAFAKVPLIDVWFSQRYYAPDIGFMHRSDPFVQAMYEFTPLVGRWVLGLAMLVALGGPLIARLAAYVGAPRAATTLRKTWRRTAIVTLCSALLSSGLVAELGFKNLMGRPRPVQTLQFGGSQPFQGVFARGNDPKHHRSFISGHATAAFSLMSLGLCAGPTWRRRWFLVALVLGAAVGIGRIMQGGHYLSDVVFSFYAAWLSCELIALALRLIDLRRRPVQGRERPLF